MINLKAGFRATWTRFGVEFSLALFLIVPALARISGQDVGTAILWATGVVLLAYTIETQGMRLEIAKQNEIAVQPLVIAGIEKRPTRTGSPPLERQVILRNIGRGPALYVEVEDIEIEVEGWGRFAAKFEVVDYVEEKKDVVADVTLYAIAAQAPEEPHKTRMNFVANLDPHYASQSYVVAARYEDVSGRRHESVTRMGKGGIRLLNHRKLHGERNGKANISG